MSIRVQPGAGRNEICGVQNGALKVKLSARPVEGAANKALIAFLAKALGLRKSGLCLASGQRSRNKRVVVVGMGEDDLKKIFRERFGTGFFEK